MCLRVLFVTVCAMLSGMWLCVLLRRVLVCLCSSVCEIGGCDLLCDMCFVVLAGSFNVLVRFVFGLLCDGLWLAFGLCCCVLFNMFAYFGCDVLCEFV